MSDLNTGINFGLQDHDLGYLCELLFRRYIKLHNGLPLFAVLLRKMGTGLFISWLLDVGRLLAHWNLATTTHLGNLLHIMNYMS